MSKAFLVFVFALTGFDLWMLFDAVDRVDPVGIAVWFVILVFTVIRSCLAAWELNEIDRLIAENKK